jgi:hypothetical protein
MWYSYLEKAFTSRHILHQHWYTCLIALLVRRNPKHKSLLTVESATSAPPFHHLRLSNVLERISLPSSEPLYATDTWTGNISLWIFFLLSPIGHKKRTTDHCLTVIPSSSTVAILILKPDSEHEHTRLLPGLSWSWSVLLPSKHIENLLYPSYLFNFHLWPIYWFSLVITVICAEFEALTSVVMKMRSFWLIRRVCRRKPLCFRGTTLLHLVICFCWSLAGLFFDPEDEPMCSSETEAYLWTKLIYNQEGCNLSSVFQDSTGTRLSTRNTSVNTQEFLFLKGCLLNLWRKLQHIFSTLMHYKLLFCNTIQWLNDKCNLKV